MEHTFRIFEPDSKVIRWSPDLLPYLLLLLFFILDKSEIESLRPFAQTSGAVTFILLIILWFRNLFRVKRIKGKLKGRLMFTEDSIIIRDEQIPITTIDDIYLRTDDYYGGDRGSYNFRPSPTRVLSNGTNNLLDISVKGKPKRIKVFFQMEYEEQYQVLRPFVIALIKNNIVTFEKGAEFLKINDDKYWMMRLEEDINTP